MTPENPFLCRPSGNCGGCGAHIHSPGCAGYCPQPPCPGCGCAWPWNCECCRRNPCLYNEASSGTPCFCTCDPACVNLCSNAFYVCQPANYGITTQRPEFQGTAQQGVLLFVAVDNGPAQPIPVQADGGWSYTMDAPLEPGNHMAEFAAVLQSCGHCRQPMARQTCCTLTRFFMVATDNPIPTILSPQDGDYLDTPTPRLTGTGKPGYRITVTVDGDTYTTVVDSEGRWSILVDRPLSGGTHLFTAVQMDAQGNVSVPAYVEAIVATLAPPIILKPKTGELVGLNPSISGTALPNARIYVTINRSPYATEVPRPYAVARRRSLRADPVPYETTADAQGFWQLTLPRVLPQGLVVIYAAQEDAQGNVSRPAQVQVFVSARPLMPLILYPEDGSVIADPLPTVTGTGIPGLSIILRTGGQVYQTTVDTEGTWSVALTEPLDWGTNTLSAVQADDRGNESDAYQITVTLEQELIAPVILFPEPNSLIKHQTVEISGTGTPGLNVSVTAESKSYLTPVDHQGQWSVQVEFANQGVQTITAVQVNRQGQHSPPATVHFTIYTVPVPIVLLPTPDQPLTTNRPEFHGKGVAGMTVLLTLDKEAPLSIPVDAGGVWRTAFGQPLSGGSHTARFVQMDKEGNVSEPVTLPFRVYAAVVNPPILTQPQEDALLAKSEITVQGLGTPGDRVFVQVDDKAYSTTVDAQGQWMVLTDPLEEGPHSITAYTENALGDVSTSVAREVRLAEAGAPRILSVRDQQELYTTAPAISGTGWPGGQVYVQVDEAAYQSPVAADGRWSVQSDVLPFGTHEVTAYQETPDGYVSDPASLDFSVYRQEPPVLTYPCDGIILSRYLAGMTIYGFQTPYFTTAITLDGSTRYNKTSTHNRWAFTHSGAPAPGKHVLLGKQSHSLISSGTATSEFLVIQS